MLGINDFQSVHQYTVSHSAQGIAALVGAIRRAPVEPGMPTPEVLVVAPPPAQESKGSMAVKFSGAADKCAGLADAYRQVAVELNCHFLDAGLIVTTSAVDGVHLDADQHLRLGREVAPVVGTLLSLDARSGASRVDVEIRRARPDDAEAIVAVVNPIISAGIYTAFDTPLTADVERDCIRNLPARGGLTSR